MSPTLLSRRKALQFLSGAPLLPLFAYGAVGFAHGRFYVCARKVDQDPRQQFRFVTDLTVRGREALAHAGAHPLLPPATAWTGQSPVAVTPQAAP